MSERYALSRHGLPWPGQPATMPQARWLPAAVRGRATATALRREADALPPWWQAAADAPETSTESAHAAGALAAPPRPALQVGQVRARAEPGARPVPAAPGNTGARAAPGATGAAAPVAPPGPGQQGGASAHGAAGPKAVAAAAATSLSASSFLSTPTTRATANDRPAPTAPGQPPRPPLPASPPHPPAAGVAPGQPVARPPMAPAVHAALQAPANARAAHTAMPAAAQPALIDVAWHSPPAGEPRAAPLALPPLPASAGPVPGQAGLTRPADLPPLTMGLPAASGARNGRGASTAAAANTAAASRADLSALLAPTAPAPRRISIDRVQVSVTTPPNTGGSGAPGAPAPPAGASGMSGGAPRGATQARETRAYRNPWGAYPLRRD